MKCTIKSTLFFRIPEEYEIAQSYKARHPEVQDESTSEYVILTRESTYAMTIEKDSCPMNPERYDEEGRVVK